MEKVCWEIVGEALLTHFNLHGKMETDIGTISKAFCVMGGHIAGSKKLKDFQVKIWRLFLSSVVTAADVAACILQWIR